MTIQRIPSMAKAPYPLSAGVSVVVLLASALLGSCKSRHHENDGVAGTVPSRGISGHDAPIDMHRNFRPYPPANWRLAPRDDLAHVVLWVSHIVVLHAKSSPLGGLRPGRWRPEAAPSRTLEEAARIATEVHLELQKDPPRFGEVAEKRSDDVATAGLGGRLGGMRANQLPDEYLDVLAALKPGEISRVFATAMGFHILRRDTPPAQELLSARRILIRYASTLQVDATTAPPPIDRPRDAAFKLAQEVSALASVPGASFSDLATRFSENVYAEMIPNVTVWLTRDPGFEAAVVDTVSRTTPGGTTAPIDTPWGFQILQRERIEFDDVLAMKAIRLVFGKSPMRELSEATVAAEAMSQKLQREPALFDSLRATECCPNIELWRRGYGPSDLTAVLDGLPIGGISTRLIVFVSPGSKRTAVPAGMSNRLPNACPRSKRNWLLVSIKW